MANLTPVDNDPFATQQAPQQGLPVITDDGSNWAQDQRNLTPVDQNPFGPNDKGAPVESTAPWSLVPASRYADGSWGFDSNAGMLGVAKRAGQSVLHAAENLPNLYHQVGAETAANTATPQTAGQVANLAALSPAVSGDVVAPGLPGRSAAAAIIPKPSAEELKEVGGGQIQAMRDLSVHYDADHIGSMVAGTQDALNQKGLSTKIGSPAVNAVHSTLSDLYPSDPNIVGVPLANLADARQALGRIRMGNDPQGRDAARRAISSIDSFIAQPPPESVLAGPASAAADLLKTGNANYAIGKASDKINAKGDYAQFRAAGANSGANFDNTLRQQLRPLFDPTKPQRLAGYKPDEIAAISRVAEGTPLRNSLRSASSYMGGGGGGVASLEGLEAARIGNEYAGPTGAVVGAAIPFIGRGLRGIQNNLARSDLNKADELIRSRSPLYQERLANAPPGTAIDPAARAALSGMKTINAQAQPQPDALGWGIGINQPRYAKGGKVKKPTHEFLVNRLMTLAEKAKKAEKKATAPILQLPDDVVTTALAKAQEAI